MPGTVDAHVHLLPGRLADKVRGFFEAGGLVDLAYPLDHGAICDQLADEGISTVWTLPYAHRRGVAEWMNEESAATARRGLAVGVVGGATVHPDDDDPAGLVRTAVEDLGLRVLKLHCSVGDYDPADPRLTPVWEYAEAVALPVVVHAGHSVLGTTALDDLGPVEQVARRHPEARIIIAHCGHDAVDDAVRLVTAHPQVHADLTPVVFDRVDISPVDARRISDKLLFGTDAPNTGITATDCLTHVASLGLDAEQHAAVTGGNARRLVDGVGSAARTDDHDARARLIRQRYPVLAELDEDGLPPPDVSGLAVLAGELETERIELERRLSAHVVVYADFRCRSLPGELQLCRRATSAALSDAELAAIRDFERRLPTGHAACVYARSRAR